MFGCLRCDWISISLRSWCSTCDCWSWFLNNTFSATMYLLRFSRARYTLPNLPRPSGLPMSKSLICSSSGREGGGVGRRGEFLNVAAESGSPARICASASRVSVCERFEMGSNPGDAGDARRGRLKRVSRTPHRRVTYVPALLFLLGVAARARGGRRPPRRRCVLFAGMRHRRAGAGHHGRRLRELPGLRPGVGRAERVTRRRSESSAGLIASRVRVHLSRPACTVACAMRGNVRV